jgi:hypothetical protein
MQFARQQSDSRERSGSDYLKDTNAYSLLGTAVPGDDHHTDAMLSSSSDLDQSLHRCFDMFKMLPAQFESEMVHANIQTEEDWSHIPGRLGSHEHSVKRQNKSCSRSHSVGSDHNNRGKDSQTLYQNGGHSFDFPHQMSPGSDILEAPVQWSNPSVNSKPAKPPRTQKGSSKTQQSRDQHSSSQENTFKISNIPSISLDHPQTSSPLPSTSSYHGDPRGMTPLAVDPRLTEPLSIVPPLTSVTDNSSKLDSPGHRYKLYEIPFDDTDIEYTAAPPSETSLQLSPITIVPPPPPMDSPVGLGDLWNGVNDHVLSDARQQHQIIAEVRQLALYKTIHMYILIHEISK